VVRGLCVVRAPLAGASCSGAPPHSHDGVPRLICYDGASEHTCGVSSSASRVGVSGFIKKNVASDALRRLSAGLSNDTAVEDVESRQMNDPQVYIAETVGETYGENISGLGLPR
jgi:hypothetical protein